MKAIILSAGKGSRLHPLTEHTPKPLIELGGRPILDHIIENLPDAVDEIILITKHLKEQIQAYSTKSTDKYKKNIKTVSQGPESGTFGALLSIKDHIAPGERFFVLNGDDLHSKAELESYLKHPLATGIQHRIMPAYYATQINENGIVYAFRPQTDEEKINGAYIATGVYLIDDRIFSFPPVSIAGGELGLPQTLIAQSDIYPIHGVVTTQWQPINNFDDLEQAKKRFE